MKPFPSIYISELLPEEDLYEIIHEFSVGLELIQFSISDQLDNLDETICSVKETLNRLDNPETTVHGPFLDLNPMSYDSLIRSATMDRFKAARDAALSVGAKKIIFHSGMIPTVYFIEGWAERVSDFFNEFLEDSTGITVCMENVLDREILPILEVKNLVPRPGFELCLDAGHAHCYSSHDVGEWASVLKAGVGHLHLHDNHGVKDEHLALDSGTMPWRNVLDIIYDSNPDFYAGKSYNHDCLNSKIEVPSITLECSDKYFVQTSILKLREYFQTPFSP